MSSEEHYKEMADELAEALRLANEQLEAWRESFSQYADNEDVACQIDNALIKYNAMKGEE